MLRPDQHQVRMNKTMHYFISELYDQNGSILHFLQANGFSCLDENTSI
jgi:hypothetical protein